MYIPIIYMQNGALTTIILAKWTIMHIFAMLYNTGSDICILTISVKF